MLTDLFSQERLQKYGWDEKPEILVVQRYQWNLELSSALYPCLSLLEVGLRNRIDNTLSGLNGPEWLNEQSLFWIQTASMKRKNIVNSEQDAIIKTKERLKRENGVWTRPKLVAELNFGFWTNLFKPYYHPVIWHRKDRPMGKVFLESPKISPKQAFEQLSRIKKLRNRIAHHEAIWNKPKLFEDYQTVYQLIEGLGGPLKSMADELDRFPLVWSHNPG